jgi:hypothetical protein
MTNNHPQLVGVYTQLYRLLGEYNMATREGTLKQMANKLKEIGDLATAAEGEATKLIFPPKIFTPPPEEDE